MDRYWGIIGSCVINSRTQNFPLRTIRGLGRNGRYLTIRGIMGSFVINSKTQNFLIRTIRGPVTRWDF